MTRTFGTEHIAIEIGLGAWAVCAMSRGTMEYCGADLYWSRDPRFIGKPFASEAEALAMIEKIEDR